MMQKLQKVIFVTGNVSFYPVEETSRQIDWQKSRRFYPVYWMSNL